jgi:asparagine synthase (glutamine-hydrolysing)
MTFVAAVAVGVDAADSLQAAGPASPSGSEVTVTRHLDLAVAWARSCRWVDTHDDGDVLVVVDGRLHGLGDRALGDGEAGPAELLARRYRERGADVARGLLGDFVVIVLDRSSSHLLVARDPLGVRPWYQVTAGGRQAGASDLATLVGLPWVDTTLDDTAAIEYLAAVYESRGDTLYRSVKTLPPGTTWVHGCGRARAFSHHRWQLEPDLDITWDDAVERCRTVLDEAVRCRLRGAGPPASELSGGFDSSAVVGTIVGLGHDDMVAGRLVFDGPRADERAYSDAVVGHWRIRAVSSPPWVPSDDESEALTRRLARPVPDPHFMMFTGLHRLLQGEGRLDGLTGLGGDDAFATCSIGSRVVSALKLRQRAVLGRLARAGARQPWQLWAGIVRPTLHHLAPWKGDRLPGWVRAEAASGAQLPRLYRRRPQRVTGVDAIDERLANMTSGYDAAILEERAVVGDLAGRRDSHPFLDPRLVAATYGLDPWWPSRDDHNRALQVAAYADRLPPAVAERRSKADFSEVFWPQLLREEVLARVRTGPLAEAGWLDPAGFESLVVNAQREMANAAIPLSRCVSLDRWMRTR